MKFETGDDVLVEFDGWEHRGEVKTHNNGWVTCKIHIDPDLDYGAQTPRLSPVSIVCVREINVRHANQPAKSHECD